LIKGFLARAATLGVTAAVLFGAQAGPAFPEYPPTPDADPSTRHAVEVSIPARLSVQRAPSSLSVAYDLASLRNVTIMVGKKMIIGMKDEFRVYLEGDTRSVPYRSSSEFEVKQKDPAIPLSNPNFLKSTEILSSDHDGIPAAGRRHVVEHDIILFETDIPAQHMWGPESSKNYRVLWEEKLNAVR
jgi:hypothetical protein